MKLTGAAILVSRGMKLLQPAPAAYPYRSTAEGRAVGRRWRFLIWLAVLTAVWVFANWPRDGGSLKRFLQWAGCPWTFAFWQHGHLEWFDSGSLAADVALGAAVAVLVAWLCAWSRGGRKRGRTEKGDGDV